jgi:mannosyl-oligosaccharide glucosidase
MFDDIYIDAQGNKQFDGHTGYLNFWPLFLYAVDPSDERFEITMRKLIDKDFGLWTPFGISSMSKYDPYYKLGDNYWTSPIWMNINFLIVKSLKDYSIDQRVNPSLRADIYQAYKELRQNVIDMIVNDYESTQFIWEVYNDETGEGMDNHPFTGWSGLVANLMAEIY